MKYIKGFSLIELLTVLVILGTLTALAMPNLAGFIEYIRLTGETRKISSDLREYHSLAITKYHNAAISHYNYEFTFDISDNSYIIEKENPSDPLDRETVKTVSIEVDITSADSPITFYPMGNASAATIVLENTEGEQSSISVSSSTGHVRIE